MKAPRRALPRFLQQGRADTPDQPVYDGGSLAEPSSGTYTLLDFDGNTVVTGAIVSPVVNKTAQYALAADALDAYDLPQHAWRERWELTIGGVEHTFENEVIVCRVAPAPHVVDEDLFRIHSDWRGFVPPGRTSYEEPILAAWEEMLQRLLGDQVLPNRVLNWWAAALVHKYWAAAIVARDFSTQENGRGKYTDLAPKYEKRANDEYERLFLKKDSDEDGVANNPNKVEAAEPELFLTAVPMPWDTRRGGV